MSAIRKNLDRKLAVLAEYAIERMRGVIASLPASGSHEAVGAYDWRLDVIDAMQQRAYNEAFAIVRKFGMVDADELTLNRAMLVNYGMGRTLERDNPFISEYVGSEYYNFERSGFGVYRREGDNVYDYETGLWHESTAKGRSEIESFWQQPSLFFDTVMAEIKQEFDAVIVTAFDNIDFSQFVEVVKKGR
jgi:hypothetical protein